MKSDLVDPTATTDRAHRAHRDRRDRRDRKRVPAATEPPAWFEVDLFAPPRKRGSRFDDTVALPIDAPGRLEAVAAAASMRLRALPEPHELGERTIRYRDRLQHVLRDAAAATARLAAGTYGACLDCAEPISLALLTQRPWAPRCVYCALDI